MKFKFNNKTIFIILFSILYLAVGLVSTIHAVQFFGLANSPVLGTILAITFEIGQAAVLFNLLTNPSQRKKFMPWALMCILTLVQILGNIFSSYKYLITNSNENLRFFKEPIFIWTELPDNEANVIITYIVGAILPIVALCLTEMVVSYLGVESESKIENNITQSEITQSEITQSEITQKENVQENVQKNEVFNTNEQEHIIEQNNNINDEQKHEIIKENNIPKNNKEISNDTKETVSELVKGIPIKQESGFNNQSHFINL